MLLEKQSFTRLKRAFESRSIQVQVRLDCRAAAGRPIVQGWPGGGVNASVGSAWFYKKSPGAGVVNPPQRPDTPPFLRPDSDIVLVPSFRQNFAGRFCELVYWIAGRFGSRQQPAIRGVWSRSRSPWIHRSFASERRADAATGAVNAGFALEN